MLPRNRYAISIEDCKKVFALYGHNIDVPTDYLDPISKEIMEIPIALNGVTERFDQSILLHTSGDLHLMDKTLINPLTRQPADYFEVDKELLKKINMFVTGMVMLAGEFKAKKLEQEQMMVN